MRNKDNTNQKPSVVYFMNYAPNYRAKFLESFGQGIRLSVVSFGCEHAGLTPPSERSAYTYREIAPKPRKPLDFRIVEVMHVLGSKPNVILCGFTPRILSRMMLFIFWRLGLLGRRTKWIWVGHIYGRSKNRLFDFLRRKALCAADGILVYTQDIKQKLVASGMTVPVLSFNNSETYRREYQEGEWSGKRTLKLLFAGRPMTRKNLERLVTVAKDNPFIEVRLVGPGMKEWFAASFPNNDFRRIEAFGAAYDNDLKNHADWCHAFAAPGHLGLMVVTAAKFGKPLIGSSTFEHAPEIYFAQQAQQFLVDWDSPSAIGQLLKYLHQDRQELRDAGERLQRLGKSEYTIEGMVEKFTLAIDMGGLTNEK